MPSPKIHRFGSVQPIFLPHKTWSKTDIISKIYWSFQRFAQIQIQIIITFELSFALLYFVLFFWHLLNKLHSHINNNLETTTNRLSSSSSEEENSPTQMNNCRKFIDKAPLVKLLSNSLLRNGHDEYRPLLNDNNFSSNSSNYLLTSTAQITSNIYNITDDPHCDANELIASKFGDSCRKSLTSVLLDNRRTKDYCDFDFKQNFLRETSSGK